MSVEAGRATKLEAFGVLIRNGGSWHDRALRRIADLMTFEGTGEDLNDVLRAGGLEEPHHHNAWGALHGAARKRGLLEATGVRRPMAHTDSHGRPTDVLRRTT